MKKLTLTLGLMLISSALFANTEGFAPEQTYWLNTGVDANYARLNNGYNGVNLGINAGVPVMKNLYGGNLNVGLGLGYTYAKNGNTAQYIDVYPEARYTHTYFYGKVAPVSFSRWFGDFSYNTLGATVGAGAQYPIWQRLNVGLNVDYTYNYYISLNGADKPWRISAGPMASMTF